MKRFALLVGIFVLFGAVMVAGSLNTEEAKAAVWDWVGGAGDSMSATPTSQSAISVSWGESEFSTGPEDLYRCSGSGSCTPTYFANVFQSSSYNNTGLSCGTTYRYRVCSDYGCTSIATAATDACTPATPNTPSASGTGQSTISVTWGAVSGASGYNVYRNSGYIGASGVASYGDSGLNCGTQYGYGIVAYVTTNGRTYYSGTSATGYGSTSACPSVPTPPSGVTATPTSQTTLTVGWTDNSSNETGFKVYSGDGVTARSTTGANATSVEEGGLSCAISYDKWGVRAYNAVGDSNISYNTPPSTLDACTPSAPSGLGGSAVSETQYNSSWTDNSNSPTTNYETGFQVERCTGGGCASWALVGSTGQNVTSYSHTGLSCGTTYRTRVRAYVNTNGRTYYSGYTAIADTNTNVCAGPDITFTPTSRSWAASNISVTVTASDPAGVATDGRYCWTNSGTSCVPTTVFQIGGVLSQTSDGSWYLCALALDSLQQEATECSGPYQKDASAPTTPGTPSATSPNTGSFTVNWTASTDSVSGLQQYRLEESQNGGAYTQITTPSTNSQALSRTQGTFVYRTRAEDNTGNLSVYSGNSATITVDTTAPSVPAPTDEGAWKNSTSITFTGTPSDTGGSGLSDCTGQIDINNTDGAGLVYNASVGTDGDHTFVGTSGNTYYYRYSCTDGAGNSSGYTAWTNGIGIDTAIPSVTAPTDAGTWTNNTSLTFSSVPSDTGGSGLSDCTGQIDVDNTDGAGLVYNASVGTDGDHTFIGTSGYTYYYRVTCSDVAGNSSGYTAWTNGIGLDTGNPSITGPTDEGTWKNSTSLTFSSVPSDTGGSGLSDCTGQIDINNTDGAGLVYNASVGTDGDHTFVGIEGNTYYYRVSCSDNAGNSSGYTAWTNGIGIDLTAPAFSSKTAACGSWQNTNWVSTFTYTDSFSGIASGNSPTCTISTDGASQTCNVTPNVCDNASNCNTTLITSNACSVDKTAPTPSTSTGSAASTCSYDGGTRSITWTITASADATSGLNSSAYSFTNGSTWQATNQLAESGIGLATTTKTVRARDVADNQTAAGTLTAGQVSCVAPPSSAPASPSGSLDGGQGTATLSWSEVSNASGYLIEESTDGGSNYSVIGDNTSNTLTTHAVPKYGQECPKDYYYRVTAYTLDPSYDSDTNCPVGYRTDRKCSTATSPITAQIRYCTGFFLGD